MQLKITKFELAGVERELSRIADCLEHLIAITDPPKEAMEAWLPEDNRPRFSYTDEEHEIVVEKLAKMGKEYKEKRV